MHDDIVSNVRENLHYLDVSIFNHILSGRFGKGIDWSSSTFPFGTWKRIFLCSTPKERASFCDKDDIPIYNNDNPQSYTFSGKRIHRGMYQCLNGKCLNTDVNAALNILRKSNVVSLVGLYSRGEVDTPVRIRIA